jgi:dienelactone hydrolase
MAAAAALGIIVGWSGAYAAGAFAPSISDTVRLAEWHYLGPFSVGPREGITGIADLPEELVAPGEAELAAGEATSRLLRYPSILAQGGFVEWQTAAPDSTGWVNLKFGNVLWDSLAAIYGAAGVVNLSYAVAEFNCPSQARALVVAERVGSFYLNGALFPGDPYGHDFVRIPVVLDEGRNRILVKLSGYGEPGFKLELVPAPAPLAFADDFTTPDLVRGETGRFWIGVPVLNTTDARVARAVLTVGDGVRVAAADLALSNLTARCVRKLPVEIEVLEPAAGETLIVPLEIACDGGTYRDSVSFRVREPGQSTKRTFISRIDGSCQYYAVLPPTDYDPGREYALILSLHGAGVRAEGQADAYKPKSWAFVVAPTNRRPFGFDWQDWGRLDALEVLAEAKAHYPVDPDRVYLTGHSMGGHGVWHVGMAHPDLFAAMGPGAGWTSFELYVPWFLQKTSIYARPDQVEARNVSLRADQSLNFVENLLYVPVFIFQGGADDNVPPVHPRLFVTRLDQLGYKYVYKEIPGKGHWWGIDSLGTSCVDDPDMLAYFQRFKRDLCPARVVLKTSDLAKTSRAYWIEIRKQLVAGQDSWIDATLAHNYARSLEEPPSTVDVRMENVRGFAIYPCGNMWAGKLRVRAAGKSWVLEPKDDRPLVFSLRGGELRLGEAAADGPSCRTAPRGPIKQAYFSPFVLVYGTAGSEAATELLLHQARLEALQWWIRGNGFVDVLPDSEVTRDTIAGYNLILFGGPGENRVTRAIDRHLPITVVDGRFRLRGRDLDPEALAAKFVYPNPLNPSRLVVVHEGRGMAGLRLATFFGALSSAAGLPDYVVFDASVRTQGWAGVRASGFFTD